MNSFFTIIVVIIALVLLNKARKKTKAIQRRNRLNSLVNQYKKKMVENYNCNDENIEVYRDFWNANALVVDTNIGKVGFVLNHKRTFKIADASSILSAYMQYERLNYINIKIVTEEFGTMHFHTYDNSRWIGKQHEYDVAYAKSGKLESLLSNLQYYYGEDSFSTSTSSMTDELRELTDMYNNGSLNEEEFTKAKARLLG
ncbi:SHOCT domain-containing protein [Priestia aryabhattai]|uniref:SHOCT domain-containing protein n=1 Tax=Priestia aryabhattai TaxID=412384 RepID=UPI0008DD7AC3|nr:SHOCT domain-containing protein [Priestia aryabhattai]OHY73531.1 hypothetical protein BCV52_25745 [Priestia aryabhattai]